MKIQDIVVGQDYAVGRRYSERRATVIGTERINVARYEWKPPVWRTKVRVRWAGAGDIEEVVSARDVWQLWSEYAAARDAEAEACDQDAAASDALIDALEAVGVDYEYVPRGAGAAAVALSFDAASATKLAAILGQTIPNRKEAT